MQTIPIINIVKLLQDIVELLHKIVETLQKMKLIAKSFYGVLKRYIFAVQSLNIKY